MVAATRRSSAGFGCLTLFGLPFFIVGMVTLYLLVQELIQGPDDRERLIILAIFPPVFGGAGLGLMVADRWARSRQREEETLKKLHPDEPWRWKPEWTTGRVRGSSQKTMWFAWGFALLWNLISMPLLFVLPDEVLRKGNWPALLGLLFPLVGAGLLWWAIKATARYRRFGVADFEMRTFPGVVGGRLQGTIHTGLKSAPADGVRVALTSIHRYVTGSGDSRSTTENILWQDEYRLAPERLEQGMHGLAVPVDFAIPPGSTETDDSDSENRKLWRLEIFADVSGVDLNTQFEVPVYVTADSSEDAPAAAVFDDPPPSAQQEYDPAGSRVVIRDSPLGGREFFFPAARNKAAAVSVTIFFLIFGGATAAMVLWGFDDDWPSLFNLFFLMFPVVFGLVSLLLLLFVLDAWTGTTRVVIEDGRLRVRTAILGLGGWKEIACSQIRDIQLGIGMQQKQTMTQSAKAYYDIEVHPEAGKKFKAGRGIRDKREAEWLVEQMSVAVLEAG